MQILHLTSLFPYSESHLNNGAGGHAVFQLIDHLNKETDIAKQHICFYLPVLSPYYGYISKNKAYNHSFRKKPWYPNLFYKKMLEFPHGLLRNITMPIWQKYTNLDYLQNLNFDIIHLHTSLTLGVLATRIKKTSEKPLVLSVRREVHNSAWKTLKTSEQNSARVALMSADSIVSPSAISAQQIEKIYSTSVNIIPNGTNTIFNQFEKETARRPKSILFIGNLDTNKNILLVIDVFKEIVKKEQKAELTIIGDGYLKETVRQRVKNNRNIRYLGRVNKTHILNEMRHSTILCVPSFTETFGIVYAEAMKQKMAVIGRANTGIDGHGIRGQHYELIDNDTDLKELLLNLINNPTKCKHLGHEGRKLAISWDWKNSATKYIKIYQDIHNAGSYFEK